eukprot:Protomagalhaensia_wolfi_Nauph_80__4411@NODE_4517_length_556_cov_2_663443_g3619_i0_p1_GENE_NODE_4517_length_556_cov_2_663443_g3619_i0NODE_4517_length_556_cov_2_663443_g3619_i0_p1_ORF_typecomplete_len104_score25_33_NODE_4517_length_556_cov_2_663443_g3619_i0244555
MDSVYKERRQMSQLRGSVSKSWLRMSVEVERDTDAVLEFVQNFRSVNLDLLELGLCRQRLTEAMANERTLREDLKKEGTKLQVFAGRLAAWMADLDFHDHTAS